MIHEDDLPQLESQLKEAAKDFRRLAFDIEKDSSQIKNHTDLLGVQWLAYMFIPPEYNPAPFEGGGGRKYYFMDCSDRVLSLEHLAYGDCGVLMASPGPGMSGHVIYDLGTEEQKEKYYSRVASRPTWTFFAITEPEKGSDAQNLQTHIKTGEDGRLEIWGNKTFIGNSHRAQMGVTFARRHAGPLGIEAIFIDKEKQSFLTEPLNLFGLKGAQPCRISFEGYSIEEKDIIGTHLSPSRRGLWGAIQTFNRMRPGVSAMALGVTRATYDYVQENRRSFTESEKTLWENYAARIHGMRALVRKAARIADQSAANGALASVAKIEAIRLVEEITADAFAAFGPKVIFEHPYLEKWYRDARAFEYMEGTSMIHSMQVNQAYLKGKIADV